MMNSNEHFRLKLAEVASKIQKEDLERLKFLCTDFIPDGDREKISSPEQLFIQLEHRRKLAPNRLAFLQKCLQQIGRHDLTYELNENAFEHHRKEGSTQPPTQSSWLQTPSRPLVTRTQLPSPPVNGVQARSVAVGGKSVICNFKRRDDLAWTELELLLEATGNFRETERSAVRRLRSSADDLDRVWKFCKVGSAVGSSAGILSGMLAAGGEVATFMRPEATAPLLTTSAVFGVTGALANLGLKTVEAFTTAAVLHKSAHAGEDAKPATNDIKRMICLLTTDEKLQNLLLVLAVHAFRVFGATHLAAALLEDSLSAKVHFAGKFSTGIITAFLVWDTLHLAITVSDIVADRGSDSGRYLRDSANDLESYRSCTDADFV